MHSAFDTLTLVVALLAMACRKIYADRPPYMNQSEVCDNMYMGIEKPHFGWKKRLSNLLCLTLFSLPLAVQRYEVVGAFTNGCFLCFVSPFRPIMPLR